MTHFHVMAKPHGPICNLDCAYCFYLEKERLFPNQKSWSMSPEVLERFVQQYIASQTGEDVFFTWQGGEPTLAGLPFFQQAVQWQRQHARGKRIHNALQTNAVLLDQAWIEFLAKERFLVGVSLDGPADLHNTYRVYKGGRGSFEDVLRAVELLKQYGVEFNTLTAVHRANEREPLVVYRFLKQIGSQYLQFLPVVERRANVAPENGLSLVTSDYSEAAQVTEWSVNPIQYGEFICTIFDEWVRNDVAQVFVQLFDVALENWLGLTPSLCVFRQRCGAALAMEHNGEVYSCDHYVYPEHRLGNLAQQSLGDMVHSAQQQTFGEAKLNTLPQYCRECNVRFACHGECPKHRFARTPTGEFGLNYLCPAYKRIFTHLDPAMRFMADELRNGRPPRNVMHWLREQTTTA